MANSSQTNSSSQWAVMEELCSHIINTELSLVEKEVHINLYLLNRLMNYSGKYQYSLFASLLLVNIMSCYQADSLKSQIKIFWFLCFTVHHRLTFITFVDALNEDINVTIWHVKQETLIPDSFPVGDCQETELCSHPSGVSRKMKFKFAFSDTVNTAYYLAHNFNHSGSGFYFLLVYH